MDEQLNKIKNYAASIIGQDQTGHGMDHIYRVVRLAKQLAEKEQADLFITQAAAYLHDVIDDKVVKDADKAHRELEVFLLEQAGLSSEQVQAIFLIIDHLSFSKELSEGRQSLSLEGQIVQDADRIDALGAIGILRTAYFGGSHGHPIYDPDIQPIEYTNKKDYRKGSTVINHFYEKLLLLPEKMNTTYGKQEAERRKRFMEAFLDEFYEEWAD